MKFAARLVLLGTLTYLLSFYAPWWIVFILSFIMSFFIHGSGLNTFISGFLGVGGVWLGVAWYIDFKAESVFSSQIVQMFPFDDSIYLIILSGLIGGLCGAFGSLTGNSFKLMFMKKKTKGFYN